MTGTKDKVRSLFLATMMILSVFGGSIALMGSATAAANSSTTTINDSGAGESTLTIGHDSGDSNVAYVIDVDGNATYDPGTDIYFNQTTDGDTTTNITIDTSGLAVGSYDVYVDAGSPSDVAEPSDGQDITSTNTWADIPPVTLQVSDANFQVSDLSPAAAAVNPGDSVTITANITNTGDVDGTQDVNVTLNGGILDSQSVTLAPGETSEVSFTENAPENTGDFVHGIETLNDSQTGDLEVAEDGFIQGSVRDTDNDPIRNATVEVTNENTSQVFRTTTDDSGSYTIRVPGSDDTYSVEVDREGFESFDTAGVQVAPGETERIDVTLEALINADDIQVSPSSDQALADGDDTVEYTVTVLTNDTTDDNTLEPLSGVDVDAAIAAADDSAAISGIPDSGTTNADGEVTFTASSSVVQSATFQFSAPNGQGGTVSTTAAADFIPLSGEGYVLGQVFDVADDDDHGLENATVYAVEKDRALENSITVDTPNTAGNSLFYRVIDEDTGEPLDYNEYRVDNDGQNAALALQIVRELNTTDRSVGSGFAVQAQQNNAGPVFVTPLEPGNYSVEASNNQPDASSDDFADTSAPAEPFTDLVPTTEVTEDLTAENARNIEEASGANIVDTTDEFGDYVLNDMFADNQAGIEYTLVAEKAGFERDYVDTTVTADGALFQDGEDANFDLEPREVDPNFVDVTNVGLLVDGEVEPFENQSDSFEQVVPRDGSVDVIDVDTGIAGGDQLTNATVQLEVPDNSGLVGIDPSDPEDEDEVFNGQFLSSADGGEVVSVNEDATTITVTTGEDGEARVFLETDRSGQDFEPTGLESGVFAELTTDSSATDFTNKSFAGVINYATNGSINAPITNENNVGLPNSVVFVTSFEDANGNTVEIAPTSSLTVDTQDAVESAEFSVTFEGETVTVTGDDLQNFDLAGAFNDISTVNGEPVTLLTFPGDNSQYTLPRVPATDAGIEYTIRGIQFETGATGQGTSANPVQPGFTQPGNIVITGATPLTSDFQVSNLTPMDVTVEQGDVIDVSATVTNNGGVGTQAVEFRVGGNAIASQSVSLEPGETTTVEFENIDTAVLEPGEYTHGVFTSGDSQTATLTVESSGSGLTGIAADYDANGNGEIEIGELGTAAGDFADDEITIGELGTIAGEFAG
jgi:surface glycoprotein (TIGR04207 family)